MPGGRVRIKIRPSGSHPDILTIQDAMQQILDVFELADDPESGAVWKLVSASTNTPLTLLAELTSLVPNLDITAIARERSALIKEGFPVYRKAESSSLGPKALRPSLLSGY